MSFAYAAPYSPPVPAAFRDWRGVRHTWTSDWDGSVWDLSDPAGGVVLVKDGVEGLGLPEFVDYTHDSPVVHGYSWEGYLITGRPVYWSILTYTGSAVDDYPSSSAWILRHRAFWNTLLPGRTGVWTVELPTNEKFTLRLRIKPQSTQRYEMDPSQRGWLVEGIELAPEQPLWEGPPAIRVWDPGAEEDWFGPTGYGPDWHISDYLRLETATMTNPGDVESYIKWTVTGPATTASVGVEGIVTPIPFAVPAGQKLIINTDPRSYEATLNGVNVMQQLPDFDSRPIPAGANIAMQLGIDGEGSVQAEFPTLFVRVL